ncbi:MAG: ABC transporter substrate-binding protein [Epsilonproteobacteria bacterium]|nr:ABC transporter substrate-binding protein [Campylobacterota bacterium]
MNKFLSFLLVFLATIFLLYNHEAKFDKKNIVLGMSAPFSGSKNNLGNEMYMGANAYFQNINKHGGIYGRFVKLIARDNRYEPRIAVKNAHDFINKDKIFAFFGTVGTPTSKVILPIAIKHDIPFLGAFSGAEFLRYHKPSVVLNARVSYEEETEELIKYYVDKKKLTKIAVFYQNDSYGRSGLRGVRKALNKRNLKIIGEGSYKRNTLSVGNALYEISLTKPEVVILVGTTMPVAQFIIRAKKNKKFSKNIEFGILSFVSPKLLLKGIGYRANRIIFSQVVLSPWTSQKQQVVDYRKLMRKYYPKQEFSFVSLEGYFAAKMTTQVFYDVGKDFKKSDFIKAMQKLSQKISDESRSKNPSGECVCLHRVHLMRYTKDRFEPIVENTYEK